MEKYRVSEVIFDADSETDPKFWFVVHFYPENDLLKATHWNLQR